MARSCVRVVLLLMKEHKVGIRLGLGLVVLSAAGRGWRLDRKK